MSGLWPQRPIGELIDGLAAGVSVRSTTGVPAGPAVLKTSAVDRGRFVSSEAKQILPADISRARLNVVADSLIISRMNTPALVGDVGYVPEEFPNLFLPDRLWLARAKRGTGTCVRWLTYYLASEPGAKQLQGLATGTSGSMKNIPKGRILALDVPVPNPREQAAIAEALRDADGLIDCLRRLIAKKQAIKQGMMQKRFGLPGDLQDRAQLGVLATFLSGGTPDRSNLRYWSGDVPWISATTLKRMEVARSDQCVTESAVRAGSKFAPLDSTLVLVRGSALHSEIRASLVTARVCFNQDVKALVPSSRVEPKFLTHSLHANSSKLLHRVTSAGNTAGVLDTAVLKAFEIWLPPRDVQREVVSMLDDVNRDLELLEQRLQRALSIKTGMMQQLLTGRTRLPVEASA